MNGPFQVAQATGIATSSTTSAPVRIYKLTKPLTDQAVIVNLGYDQKVKVDFSAIANEKITLVHVGEKLIILFDNESTVTVEPFFKSRADGLGGDTRDEITVEMAPGRDISVKEFAALFPITTDTSVLPAADQGGNSNGNAQASGANFSPYSVDPLAPVPLNELAPQEELGNFVIEIPTGGNVIPDEPPPPNGFPSVAGIPLVQLDDENIPGGGGILGGIGDDLDAPVNASGVLAHDFGPDGAGTVLLSGAELPAGFTFALNTEGTQLTVLQNGTPVLLVALSDAVSGAYTVTQLASIHHPAGGDENDVQFTIHYLVTDSTGDSVAGSFGINVDDDTPVAANDGQLASVDDNVASVNIGTVAGLLSNDSYGEDGQGSPNITIATGSLGGTVTISAGNLLYTSATNIVSPFAPQVETFTYTIEDGDGDTTTATFTVQLTDAGPSINQAAAAIAADEDTIAAAPAGNPGGTDDLPDASVSTSGTLAGLNFGVDGPGNIVLSTSGNIGFNTLAGNAIETVWDGATHTLTGRDSVTLSTVFTLQITNVATGAYTFNLVAPVQHTVAGTEDDKTFNVTATVTDVEGDSATGTISVLIDDDTPVAANDGQLASVDDNVASVNIGTVAGLLSNDSYGEDGQGSPNITIATGSLGGTVTISAGNLLYTSATNIVSPFAPQVETFTYTIEDGDGDTTTATFTVQLTDAGPSINQAAAAIAADEDTIAAAPAGNPGGTDDLPDASVSTSGTLAGLNFGVDGPGNIVLSTSGNIGFNTLAGNAIETVWDGATHTLTGRDSVTLSTVFTLQITNVATGAYTFNLVAPVQHTVAGTEDDKTFNVTATVTDVEGDSATGTISVLIDDDTPVAANDGQLASVDDNVASVNIGTVAGLLSNDSYGEDGQGSPNITIATGSLGGTVTISAGNLLYTSATNIVSPFAPQVETFTYTIEDGDGDTTTATFTVQLTDAGPSINQAAAAIAADEDTIAAAPAGNPGGTDDLPDASVSTSGTLAGLNFGVDGPGNIVLSTSGNIGFNTLAGNAIETVWDGATHTLTGRDSVTLSTVFTLQITNVATGAYTFNLVAPVQHTVAGTEDDKTFNVTATVTDVEGDSATGTISVLIDDDTPVAANDGQLASVDDNVASVNIGTVAGLLSNDSYGEDGQGSPNITIATGSLGGTVTISAGNLLYTSATNIVSPFAPQVETFTYTIEDGDGDTTTATFTVQLTDAGPSINQAAAAIAADEDTIAAAPAGNPGGTDDLPDASVSTSGTLAGLNFGVDGPGNIVLSTSGNIGFNTLAGNAIETVWDGATHTLTGRDSVTLSTVFTLQITNVATGAYTFNLVAPVQHTVAGTEDDKTFNVTATVTDVEGDSATGTISVLIDDDTPVAANDGQLASVDDNVASVNIGTVAGLLSNDSYGEDGQGSPNITIATGSLGGTVTISAGNLLYTSATNIVSPFAPQVETFTYTIEDGDGDTTTATFTVQLTDAGPSINQAAAAIAADEDTIAAAPAGNPGGTDDLPDASVSTSGTLAGLNFGVDGPGNIVLSTSGNIGFNTLAGNAIETVWDGATHTLTGRDSVTLSTVFTLQITNVATGAYTFNLVAPVQHTVAGTEDDKTFNVTATVTDVEGDSATGTISVLIDDDTPVAANDGQLASVDDNVASVNIGTVAGLLSNDSYGEDGQGSPNITIATGSLGGTVTISAGNLLYTSATNIVSPFAPQVETFTYTIEDGDGDTTTATFTVQLTDAGPSINQAAAAIAADEDTIAAAPAGNPGGTDDLPDASVSTSGTLAGLNFGVDGPGNIVLSTSGNIGFNTLAGNAIETVWDGATHTLTGRDSVTLSTVFTLQITNVATGAYTFNLVAPVQHTVAGTEDDKTFNVTATVTDVEGDSATGTISVLIDDDTPVAANDGQLASVDDNVASVNIGTVAGLLSNDSYGEDGQGSPNITIATGSLGGTVTISAGNLLYTSATNIVSPFAPQVETFTYTIEDGDGDTTTATFTVQLTDAGPSINQAAAAIAADEDTIAAAPAGNPGGTDDLPDASVSTSGTLAGLNFGVDGPGNIVLSTSGNIGFNTLAGNAIETVWDGATHTLTGRDSVTLSTVFTLQITNVATGAYTFNLVAPVQHTVAGTEDDKTFNVTATVTDVEGDSATGTISVLIDDDTPVAANDGQLASVDDNVASVNIGTVAGLLSNDSYGEDGQGSPNITIATGSLGGTVTISAGNLLYTSATNIVSPFAPQVETFTYTIEDGDGDTTTATFTVQLTDAGPSINQAAAAIAADEDTIAAAPAGNPGGTDDLPDASVSTSGTLAGLNFGVDGPGNIVLSTSGNIGFNTLAGNAIETVWDGATHTLTGRDSVTLSTVFTLQITNVATGAYTFNLVAPVQHTVAGTEDDKTFNVTATVTDVEGDSATGTISVLIDDDTPVFIGKTDLIYANSSNDGAGMAQSGGTGIYNYSIGEDQRMIFSSSSSDFAVTLTNASTVGGVQISSPTVTWFSESASSAVFDFSFNYAPNPAFPGTTVPATGTLTFDKETGTYTVELGAPIQNVFTTATALGFSGYDENTNTPDNSGPADLSVVQLSPTFFVQFDGEEGNNPGPILTAGTSAPGDNAYAPGELFLGANSDVTTSGTGIGLNSDTLQKGEVLDMDFFSHNPFGLNQTADATANTIFFKFENFNLGQNGDDVVIILKLVNPDTNITTTKAIIADNGDFFNVFNQPPAAFGVTLGNGEGVVFIEPNDYNAPGENWVIYGAQITFSTEGITGTGINLIGGTGALGGSSTFQEFEGTPGTANPETDTSDNDVLKIQSIGFITSSTQDANLIFDVTNVDADGDTTTTTTLNVTIEGSTTFTGGPSDESIQGTADIDTINGNGGNDILFGGGAKDTMNGGTGADIYKYTSESDSGVTNLTADVISGWDQSDIIDLSAIDANINSGGDQAFSFVAANSPGTVNNSITWTESGGNTNVSVDTNGVAGAEMMFVLTGVGLNLTQTNFNL